MDTLSLDPRPLCARAHDQLTTLIARVAAGRLDDPTPCAEFDVRGLLAHLVGGVRAAAELGRTGADVDIEPAAAVPDDGWPAAYAQARALFEKAWADDATLDARLTLPWGKLSGRDYLSSGCVLETVTHTWDLSRALGHPLPLDQELAEYALAWARRTLPADRRGEGVPFGPVRPAPQGADAYGQLAAWLGRDAG
ncbi:TIGR03086 family metal-binding protein [Streptomyces sp. NPDC053048]|uniref:TIGR03086 family metal-binding protein n=1 Tax=Streptomyces sp. NPDC053048 TaxID=3365694 RepID=UPI0037D11D2D